MNLNKDESGSSIRALTALCIGLLLAFSTHPAAAAIDREKAQVFYEDALARFKAESFTEAVIQLRNALQQDPDNLPARILLGRTLMREDQVTAAISELEKALSLGGDENLILIPLAQSYLEMLQPERVITGIVPEGHQPEVDAELLVLHAQAYLMLGNTKQAEESFLAAGVLLPADPRPLLGRANILLSKGKREKANKVLEQAVAVAPDDFDVWIFKALLHRDAHEYTAAVPAFERALELRPTSGRALTARAAMWMDLGRVAQAQEDLEKATELEVDTLETIYLRTLLLFRDGKQDEARAVLRESADKIRSITEDARAKLPHTSLMLGIVAYFNGNNSEAVEHFRVFLAKSPDHAGAKRYLAATYLALGEWDELIKVYRPSPLSEPPNEPMALSLLAEAYRAQGNFAAAERYYEAAMRLAPNSAGLGIRLAMSRLDAGKSAQALKDLTWLIENFPDLLEAKIQLVNVYVKTGRIDEAKSYIEGLADVHLDNAEVQSVAGAVNMMAGDLDLAREYTRKAAALGPDLILPQLNLARIARAGGYLGSAESQYRTILGAHPQHMEAALELCQLLLQQGDMGEALERVEALLENNPDSFKAALLRLEIQMRSGVEPERVRATALELTQTYPDEPELDLFVGQMHADLGELADAKRLFRHAGEKAEFDTAVLLETAKHQIALPDLSGALWSLTKAIQGSPGHAEAETLKATVLIDLGDYVQSDELLVALEEAHGEMAPILSARGHWHMAQGRYDDGIGFFENAYAQDPSSESVNTLFRAYQRAGRIDSGVELLQEWSRQFPEDFGSRHKLAQALIISERYGEARQVYEALRSDGVEDIVLLNNLATVYQRLGDGRALSTAELAYKRAPEVPSVLDTYGWILAQNGRPQEGLALLREAYARSSTGPEIRYHIGLALLGIGKKEEAVEELTAAIEGDVWFADIADARALLGTLQPASGE